MKCVQLRGVLFSQSVHVLAIIAIEIVEIDWTRRFMDDEYFWITLTFQIAIFALILMQSDKYYIH